MATLKGGLCLILILWTSGSRPPNVPARSPDSSEWWDHASKPIHELALRHRKAGDYRSAEELYKYGYEEAVRRKDPVAAVRFLISVGGCQLGDFRYRDALATLLRARSVAQESGVRTELAGIALNLSSVYTQMWDYSAAVQAAEDGITHAAGLPLDRALPYLLLQAGRLRAILGREDSISYLKRGIEAARSSQDQSPIEASGWDWLGEEYQRGGRLEDAEQSFGEAFRLRTLFRKEDLGYSYAFLGALRLAQGDLNGAEMFTRLALGAARSGVRSWPLYLLDHQQGQIELRRGKTVAALRSFETAVEEATTWRLEVLPAKTALAQSNIGMEKEVVRSFAVQAARYAVETGSTVWAEKAFQAMELNRAVSLRESIALRDAWRERLPGRYWEILGRLQAILLRAGDSERNAEANRLRSELTEMETQAGMDLRWNKEEIFRTQTSLIHFREGLGESELFLSFVLGERESFLWAVSRQGMHLYKLDGEQEIAERVAEFRDAVRDSRSEAANIGHVLYKQLFGQLSRAEVGKSDWSFSLEGELFNLPFAALTTGQRDGKAMYLVEEHSIQTVPGALFRTTGSSTFQSKVGSGSAMGGFLGVGDPIYNSADARWTGPRRFGGVQLSRLSASEAEVFASAKAWTGESTRATILVGAKASRSMFLNALHQDGRGRPPAVIHLATHVRIPEHRLDQGLIAFSMATTQGGEPQPEYLDTSQVSTLFVKNSLVVMTGCETSAGDAREGAGLLGLTRAWLMAGARGVIATGWPVEDTSGEIFSHFYRQLRDHSPAEALRRSQLEMARASTWHRDPAYWASYQLTGGFQ